MSYYNPDLTLMNIRNLAGVHPPEIAELLDAEISIDAAQLHRPSFEDFADPALAEQAVHDLALYNSINGEAFAQAKAAAYSSLAGRLTRAVQQHQGFYIEQITAGFDSAAEEYVKNIEKLPEEFTADEVLGFTPALFKTYGIVRSAAASLMQIRTELVNFPDIVRGSRLNTRFSSNHLILGSDSVEEWNAVQHYEGTRDNAFNATAPDIRHALEAGAELRISTVSEAEEHCLAMAALA